MADINIIELANYCTDRKKEMYNSSSGKCKYVNTLYVAISEDNNILCSYTPHILKEAQQCILIHQKSELAVSNWYSWYNIEVINKDGEVLDRRIDDEFELCIVAAGGYTNQTIELSADKRIYYWGHAPWEVTIKRVWKLYTLLKDVKTVSERILISDLFERDETIAQLKKENEDFKFTNELLRQEKDQYKGILDEVKKMFNEQQK